MRLADFIANNTEDILVDWVAFARTCGPRAGDMDAEALRDHAGAMLRNIILDLRTPQTASEQVEKSKGNAPVNTDGHETAAEVHGAGRAESGFTVGEMVAEYRALRASVIRLWTKKCGHLGGEDLEDLMRFNEAIDQSLAESVIRYTHDVEQAKEIFLAILGHDLRNPLGAIITSSQFMLDTGELKEPYLTLTARNLRCSRKMSDMVGELLDFTRGKLGGGIPITAVPMDLNKEVRHAVDEMEAAFPGHVFNIESSGDLSGMWDCGRIAQMLSNLLGNAVAHGEFSGPVTVRLAGKSDAVNVDIHNNGRPILDMKNLFNPFKRLESGSMGGLGLGLYIVERIVDAHHGTITVKSRAGEGTSFIVSLPRYRVVPK